MTWISFFSDPLLRAPTIGCMLMCLSCSLIGVVIYIQKRSLLCESLSHASYPGIIVGNVIFAKLFNFQDFSYVGSMVGGIVFSLLALYVIEWMVKRCKVTNDTALCFVLASFFGLGVVLISRIQVIYTRLYQQLQVYLFGQAATMRDNHLIIYAILAFFCVVFVFFLFRGLQTIYFQKNYADTIFSYSRIIELCVFILLVMAIIIGMKSIGIILLSGMLIAPAIAARQFTNHLSYMFVIAAIIGMTSGFFGNYLSVQLSNSMKLSFPTGPLIVLIAVVFAFIGLFLSPKRGVVFRWIHLGYYKVVVAQENILKWSYKISKGKPFSIHQFITYHSHNKKIYFCFLLFLMQRKKWIKKASLKKYELTLKGKNKAIHIIRLHRLWEVYLDFIGVKGEKIHHNAEKMEHIISPELENILEKFLNHPRVDPHNQKIPELQKGI